MKESTTGWRSFLKRKDDVKAGIAQSIADTNLQSAQDLGAVLEDDVERYFHDLSEEKGRSRQRGIYRFYCMIGYAIDAGERQRGLDDILADIRALPNVTIVSVVVGNERVSPQTYVAGLSVKFIPSTPGTFNDPEDIKRNIILATKRTRNVQRVFRVSYKLERLE